MSASENPQDTKRMKSDEVNKSWGKTLRYVEDGGTVIIERYNTPVAHLVPAPTSHKETKMTYRAETTITGTVDGEAAEVVLTCICRKHRSPKSTTRCLDKQRKQVTGYAIKATSVTSVALASDGTRHAF